MDAYACTCDDCVLHWARGAISSMPVLAGTSTAEIGSLAYSFSQPTTSTLIDARMLSTPLKLFS